MSVPYRPLGHIRETVMSLGLDVTYEFEDLVMIEHNAFLLQMGERGEDVRLYFNTDSLPEERESITAKLQQAGHERQLLITRKGTFSMVQQADAQIDIQFYEDSD